MALSHFTATLAQLAVLVPLMVPRVGASLRRTYRGDVGLSTGAALDGDCCANDAESHADLVAAHAALTHQLDALRQVNARLVREAEQRAAETQRLEFLAHHDPLTGLPNRVLLLDRLSQALAFAHRVGTGVLVAYLDLDRFKEINDTLGHAAGDRVLAEVGARIARCTRSADTAARLGGDEFVVVCSTLDAGSEGPEIARRLLAAIAPPIDVFGISVSVGVSIGISICPADATDARDLLAHADAAMYHAKQAGRSTYALYGATIATAHERRLQREAEVRAALAADDLPLTFLPLIDARSGEIIAARAVPPEQLGEMRDGRGVADELMTRLVNAAARDAASDAFAALPELQIVVHASAPQIARHHFVATVALALQAHRVAPQRLVIEITEKTFATDTAGCISVIAALRRIGIGVTIANYGVGASALAALRLADVQTLAIDASLVARAGEHTVDTAIVGGIVALGHGLGMHVVADGATSMDHVRVLESLGIDAVSGEALAAPLAPTDFAASVRAPYATRTRELPAAG